jgi:ferredoxin
VIEGQGVADAVQPVGLILGSADAVALDTLAAHAIGYDELNVWTSIHGHAVGLGANQIDRIIVRGMNWDSFQRKRLLHPALEGPHFESLTSQITRRMNNTLLRPRPVIVAQTGTSCGACADRCPVGAIGLVLKGSFRLTRARVLIAAAVCVSAMLERFEANLSGLPRSCVSFQDACII